MTRDEIKNRVIEIACENFQADRSRVTETTLFVDDLGADALDLLELTMELEDEFDIEIPDDVILKKVMVKDGGDENDDDEDEEEKDDDDEEDYDYVIFEDAPVKTVGDAIEFVVKEKAKYAE